METFAFFGMINNKKCQMKVKDFLTFTKYIKTNENSDLDWSDKNWDESGVDGENPPNSGFEGTSAEKMDYYAGDYGETSETDALLDEEEELDTAEFGLENIKAMIDDLTDRVNKLASSKT